MQTGIGELDRVLGGGLVPGSVVLIAGEPGVGKSTLTLQAAAGLARRGHRVLLVLGEESLEQVAARAARLGGLDEVEGVSATDLGSVLGCLQGPEVIIVDSVQTLRDPASPGHPGSPTQVRRCAQAIAECARGGGAAVVLVGHVTKDGSVAGPRVLEHLVDAVLTFEGDRGHIIRTLRASKNRFGPSAEVGVFEMVEGGLRPVADASTLFLSDRRSGLAGSAIGCVLEGRRPLALEVQALVVGNQTSLTRRVTSGIDGTRIGMLAAVLESKTAVKLAKFDVYASVVGGLRTTDPGMDLAAVLALASARFDKPVPDDLVAIGEVGLGGEVRCVPGIQARLNEAGRLGFRRVLLPASGSVQSAMQVINALDIGEALSVLDR